MLCLSLLIVQNVCEFLNFKTFEAFRRDWIFLAARNAEPLNRHRHCGLLFENSSTLALQNILWLRRKGEAHFFAISGFLLPFMNIFVLRKIYNFSNLWSQISLKIFLRLSSSVNFQNRKNNSKRLTSTCNFAHKITKMSKKTLPIIVQSNAACNYCIADSILLFESE